MALNSASLKSALQSIYTSFPATRQNAADQWASAYSSYASGAQSCSGTPVSLAAAEALLSSSLNSAFGSGTAVATAVAMSTALTTFWLAPPIVFAGPTPGAVSLVGGTAVLQAGLLSLWSNNVANGVSASQAAQDHADLFDIFTKTVLVVHVPPAPCSALLF